MNVNLKILFISYCTVILSVDCHMHTLSVAINLDTKIKSFSETFRLLSNNQKEICYSRCTHYNISFNKTAYIGCKSYVVSNIIEVNKINDKIGNIDSGRYLIKTHNIASFIKSTHVINVFEQNINDNVI